jgi:hypothetical protein
MKIVVRVELIADRGDLKTIKMGRIDRPSQTPEPQSVGLSLADGNAQGGSQHKLCGVHGYQWRDFGGIFGRSRLLTRVQFPQGSMFRFVGFPAQNDQDVSLANARPSLHHGCIPSINPVSVRKKVHTDRR